MSDAIKQYKKPSFGFALISIGTIVVLMAVGLIVFKANIQSLMLLAWVVFGLFAFRLGWRFEDLEAAAFRMIHQALQATILMAAVGVLIAAWISAGTVPTIIYAGLKVISPQFFLLTTALICAITSTATGSSWTTMGTVGLSMLGVGLGLGIPVGLTAGAIISGSYFGDKMSPLSDSTLLAAAVCKVPVFTHIRHMLYTTGPAMIIACILYTFIGFKYAGSGFDHGDINAILNGFNSIFKISWVTLLPALVVLIMIFKRVSAVFSVLIGAIVGLVIAVLYQGFDIQTVLSSVWMGFEPETNDELMISFLKRGGISSMMSTIALTPFALGLGGMMRETGVLHVILEGLSKGIKSIPRLVFSTMIVSYFSSAISGSMHFSAVITGTLMEDFFQKFNLRPENLSRIIEDCGTLGAALIPWSTNAVFIMGMLGVEYLEYLPYAFLNWIDPLISLFLGITGIAMTKLVVKKQ